MQNLIIFSPKSIYSHVDNAVNYYISECYLILHTIQNTTYSIDLQQNTIFLIKQKVCFHNRYKQGKVTFLRQKMEKKGSILT